MLILSRKPNESIRIGRQICITIAKVVGNKVSIGVSAPRFIRIDREEVPVKSLDSVSNRVEESLLLIADSETDITPEILREVTDFANRFSSLLRAA